jgi:hypothetical protein
MKTKLGYLILGAGLVFTMACTKYPPDSERVTEDLVVATQVNTKADFNLYKTYSIGDIIKITDHDTTTETGSTAVAVVDQIAKDMNARGFSAAVSPQLPDLGISIVYYQNTTIYTYSYYGYWGYPYYGYGYYYPYYPTYYSSYTTGAAVIQLVDLKYPTPSNQLTLQWTAMIRALLTDSHTTSEITGAVDQAFIQTPTLKTNATK